MRSSQRCSESFSCEEKYRRMSRLTFPLGAAGTGFSAGDALDLADAALPLAFSAGLALDFSGGADGAAGLGLESAAGGGLLGRFTLFWGVFFWREACFQAPNFWGGASGVFS